MASSACVFLGVRPKSGQPPPSCVAFSLLPVLQQGVLSFLPSFFPPFPSLSLSLSLSLPVDVELEKIMPPPSHGRKEKGRL